MLGQLPWIVALTAMMIALPGPAADADELPHRKAGLWETTTGGKTLRQCIDDATDQMTRSMASGSCAKRTVTKTSDGYLVEVSCKTGSVSIEGKSMLTGDFNSEVKVEGTSVLSGMPNQPGSVTRKTSVVSRWIGPCGSGQKPGDVILPDGKVIHMPALRK